MRITGESLQGIKLFASLNPDARAELARTCVSRSFDARTDIVVYGDGSNDVFFLLTGRVRATIFSVSGKEVAFRDLAPGDAFGDLSAIDGRGRCASVIALNKCVTLSMSASQFRNTYREYPDIAEAVMRQLSGVVRGLSERVLEQSTLGVRDRVCAELLRIAHTAECRAYEGFTWAPCPPTHDDIAKRISTQREAVTKEISELRRQGILEDAPGGGWIFARLDDLRARVETVKGTSVSATVH